MGQNAILNITDGGRAGSFDLNSYGKDVVIIGRSSSCDIVVQNPKVSHQHGKFYKQNGFWFYQDMNSTNGTIVNGKKISSVSLNSSDVMIFDTVPGADSLKIDVKLVETADPIGNGNGGNNGGGFPVDIDLIPKPPKKKGKIALIIGLAAILVAAIVVVIILLTKNSGVNSSPEKCAVNFIKGVAERDNDKIKKSVHKKMRADIADLNDVSGAFSSMTMEDIKAGTPRNISNDELKGYKGQLKAEYDLDVEEVKVVKVSYTASLMSVTEESSIDIYCAKIDSDWYVIDFGY